MKREEPQQAAAAFDELKNISDSFSTKLFSLNVEEANEKEKLKLL